MSALQAGRPCRLVVRTVPSHGTNSGSNPGRVIGSSPQRAPSTSRRLAELELNDDPRVRHRSPYTARHLPYWRAPWQEPVARVEGRFSVREAERDCPHAGAKTPVGRGTRPGGVPDDAALRADYPLPRKEQKPTRG